MWIPALRRLLLLIGVVGVGTLVISVVFGLSWLLGWHLQSIYEEEELKQRIFSWVRHSEVAVTFLAVVAALAVGGYFLWVWKGRHKLPEESGGKSAAAAPAPEPSPVSTGAASWPK